MKFAANQDATKVRDGCMTWKYSKKRFGKAHGCDSPYIGSVAATEKFGDQIAWLNEKSWYVNKTVDK
jgi:hypothetical protein